MLQSVAEPVRRGDEAACEPWNRLSRYEALPCPVARIRPPACLRLSRHGRPPKADSRRECGDRRDKVVGRSSETHVGAVVVADAVGVAFWDGSANGSVGRPVSAAREWRCGEFTFYLYLVPVLFNFLTLSLLSTRM